MPNVRFTPVGLLYATLLLLSLVSSLTGCAADAVGAETFADTYPHGAVAADHPAASLAGARVLAQGGNAVDAAVAASFALSVTRPMSTGIGGGGFMVVYLPDDPQRGRVRTAVNFRETAPAAAGPGFYEQGSEFDSRFGGRAVAIPGTVAGLLYVQERYGRLSRRAVLEPAIELAEAGFASDEFHFDSARATVARIEGLEGGTTRYAPLLGQLRRELADQPAVITNAGQARALRMIARDGVRAFYEGEMADAMVRATHGAGGVLTTSDLSQYEVAETGPLVFGYEGVTFLAMPPPSSGGTTIGETLAIFEGAPAGVRGDFDSPARAHALAESFKHAFADRARWLADPASTDVPVDWLMSDARLAPFRERVARGEPTGPAEMYGSAARPLDDHGTSHMSAVDRWGGAAACTTTINLVYGSLVLVEPFGFVLNDEMDDFQARRGEANAFGLVQADANLPGPGKRPLSSMSPTIVVDGDGRVIATAGAAGGPRIITATAQVLLRGLAGEGAGEAIAAPRLHHQWLPDRVVVEEGMPTAVVEGLRAEGHGVTTGTVAHAQMIVRRGDAWEAASDPRKGGRPAGH